MNIENIPYTGGCHYEYITEKEFIEKWEDKNKFELEDLKIGGEYIFYRIAKTYDEEIVYMKITGILLYVDGLKIIFQHSGTKAKYMLIDGYKDHWLFTINNLPEDELN